jgi:hypothetical protein
MCTVNWRWKRLAFLRRDNEGGSVLLSGDSVGTSREASDRRSNPEKGLYYFIYLVCEAISTAATPGLLC